MLVVALWAAVAMFVQDVLAVLLVQAEARNRAWLSGWLDSLMWVASILTTTISVTAFQGHDLTKKIVVVAAVTLANLLGSVTGVRLGKRFVKEEPDG